MTHVTEDLPSIHDQFRAIMAIITPSLGSRLFVAAARDFRASHVAESPVDALKGLISKLHRFAPHVYAPLAPPRDGDGIAKLLRLSQGRTPDATFWATTATGARLAYDAPGVLGFFFQNIYIADYLLDDEVLGAVARRPEPRAHAGPVQEHAGPPQLHSDEHLLHHVHGGPQNHADRDDRSARKHPVARPLERVLDTQDDVALHLLRAQGPRGRPCDAACLRETECDRHAVHIGGEKEEIVPEDATVGNRLLDPHRERVPLPVDLNRHRHAHDAPSPVRAQALEHLAEPIRRLLPCEKERVATSAVGLRRIKQRRRADKVRAGPQDLFDQRRAALLVERLHEVGRRAEEVLGVDHPATDVISVGGSLALGERDEAKLVPSRADDLLHDLLGHDRGGGLLRGGLLHGVLGMVGDVVVMRAPRPSAARRGSWADRCRAPSGDGARRPTR